MKIKTLVMAAGAALTMSFAGVAFQDAPAYAQSRPYFRLFDLETHPDRRTDSTAFEQALIGEYSALSEERANFTDWDFVDAELYKHKARSAERGSLVLPDSPLDRDLTDDQARTFWNALNRLRQGYKRGGREAAPGATARAQTSYDCWIEAAEDGRDEDIARCKAAFESAMSEVERDANYQLTALGGEAAASRMTAPTAAAASAQASSYHVYFGFDSIDILPEGKDALDRAIGDALADPGKEVRLVAHADRSGAEAYNQALSERRATAVITELIIGGVDRTRVVSEAVGETRPMIATPDGAREPGNRVVEIDLL